MIQYIIEVLRLGISLNLIFRFYTEPGFHWWDFYLLIIAVLLYIYF